jgi:hypothetical protein
VFTLHFYKKHYLREKHEIYYVPIKLRTTHFHSSLKPDMDHPDHFCTMCKKSFPKPHFRWHLKSHHNLIHIEIQGFADEGEDEYVWDESDVETEYPVKQEEEEVDMEYSVKQEAAEMDYSFKQEEQDDIGHLFKKEALETDQPIKQEHDDIEYLFKEEVVDGLDYSVKQEDGDEK